MQIPCARDLRRKNTRELLRRLPHQHAIVQGARRMHDAAQVPNSRDQLVHCSGVGDVNALSPDDCSASLEFRNGGERSSVGFAPSDQNELANSMRHQPGR